MRVLVHHRDGPDKLRFRGLLRGLLFFLMRAREVNLLQYRAAARATGKDEHESQQDGPGENSHSRHSSYREPRMRARSRAQGEDFTPPRKMLLTPAIRALESSAFRKRSGG